MKGYLKNAIIMNHDVSLFTLVPRLFNTPLHHCESERRLDEPIPRVFNLILKFEASDIELWKLDLGMRICSY